MIQREPVEHINLLQKSGPAYTVGPAFVGVLALSLAVAGWLGADAWQKASGARSLRDGLAKQSSDLQAAIAARAGERERNATALALRAEIERLQPRARVSQAVVDALGTVDRSRQTDVAAALAALGSAAEPGVWLTALTVGNQQPRLEVRGEGRDNAAVLRFARRVNDALRPLALRLEQIDIQPPSGTPASALTAGGPVAFVLK